ncbi:MAG: LysM peptidoglycan-binding domain-containing protein [Sphingobacteriia bacterium]|nr:LysM peptidoglycan-binding domain-containing protein [Sphingobacteriia bacterium]NCC40922.1 LysM peptidoglycan-binding domain-containing protein [Gammaproteobacteria bacterium]
MARGSADSTLCPIGIDSVRQILIMTLMLFLSGCGTQPAAPVGGWRWSGSVPDGYYLINEGDSLSALAARRGLPLETLAGWNQLHPPFRIYAGQLLRVQPPESSAASPTVRPEGVATAAAPMASVGSSDDVSWAWPLPGTLDRGFRANDPARSGLRIRGRKGQHVQAAAAGVVVYSGGGLQGYGNLIIVKHNHRYLSAYGLNRSLFVKEGDRVGRGQTLAEIGQADGRGPYLLHFEIRRNGKAVDPLPYLPSRD